MSFAPDIIERLARARADLRMGVPIVLTGHWGAFAGVGGGNLDGCAAE